ncbi:MAG: hypothetical protein EB060_08705 [Proteobacteria bacterium]|nr:hypothetical protein [Pseudomonadota bacterium]
MADIATTYQVYYRNSWSAAWVYDANLYPTGTIEQLAAPDYGSASILRDIGQIKRENWTEFFQVAPLSLVGYYVWIQANYNGNVWTAFLGVITDQSDILMDDATVSGYQTFIAREIGFVLDRKEVRTSKVFRNGNQQTVDRVYQFNELPEIGVKLRGNKSRTSVAVNGYANISIFDDSPADRNSNPNDIVWDGADAVGYLVAMFAPSNINFIMAGQFSALGSIEDTWNLEGYTAWQAICNIIHRRYGLSFHLAYDATANTVVLYVWTTTDVAITFGSATIPANAYPTTFTIPPDFPFNHIIDTLQLRLASTTAYRTIMVRGGFVKATATYSYTNNGLKEGWKTELENSYKAPGGTGADEKDRRRAKEEFESVYSRLVVPRTWDGTLKKWDNTGTSYAAIPFTTDGVLPQDDDVGDFAFLGKRFERDLPFRKGYKYTQDPPVNNNISDAQGEFQPIMAWIKDDYDGDEHTKTNRYIPIDHITEMLPDVSVSVTVAPLAKQLGIEIKTTPNHLMAGSSFVPADESKRYPEFNYKSLLVTATVQCDERIKRSTSFANGPPNSELLIDVPDLECWYIHPHTVVDIDNSGNPVIYVGPQLIRDDTAKVNGILAAAKAWYGQIRQAVSIPLKRVDFFVSVGSFLTGITGQSLSVPVRAPVTAKRINVESNSMTVETGWLAKDYGPDFSRATGVTRRRAGRARGRR